MVPNSVWDSLGTLCPMPKVVWLDGVLSPLEEAKVTVADHAYLYGDGLFEGIRIYDGKIFKLDEHLDRMLEGCHYLGFNLLQGKEGVKEAIIATCAAAQIRDGYIRLNVTRGTGLGLDPKHIKQEASVMVMVNTLALYPAEAYENGLDVITCSFRVIPPDSLDPRIKCIGRYASNILAKQEANRAGAGEGLMLNHQGILAECTGDNLFFIRKGVIYTPDPTCGILKGITRDTVMDLARAEGIQVVEGFYTRYDLLTAEECFLTGTAAEVIPMVTLDGQKIGGGQPGPITRRMMNLYKAETQNGTEF